MRPTRRGGTVAALAAVLAVLAIIFGRPLPLAGAALVGAWLLAHQYRFARDLERSTASLSVVQSPARTDVRTGDEVPITLAVERDAEPGAETNADTALTVEVEAGLPVAARATTPFAVTLEPTTDRASRTRRVAWPVAGRHDFEQPTVTATDGLFRETLSAGSAPTVTVEPLGPRGIHVGEGGDRIAASYGLHDADRTGTGIEPAELREYVPGDAGNRIDWKATARLMTPYVREYEAETDRRTLLVVDHRGSLATGPPGETKLAFLREVALVVAGTANRHSDPIGLVTVGDGGSTDRIDVAAAAVTYRTIRQRLLDLEPTADPDVPSEPVPVSTARAGSSTGGTEVMPATAAVGRGAEPGGSLLRRRTTPADVQRSLADLEGADDAFADALRPFYADRQVYRQRMAEDPLYGAVNTAMTATRNGVWTVICTDDSRPTELRETVRLARQSGTAVTVLLAPSVLYEPAGLADVERAYERYVAFEEFRRDLARMDGVTALEVAPTDRLSAVLEAGRSGTESRAEAGAGGDRA